MQLDSNDLNSKIRNVINSIGDFNDSVSTDSQNGRPRLNEEDKAYSSSFSIPKEQKEILNFIPGEGNSKKIQFLIEFYSETIEGKRRQFEYIKRSIDDIYLFSKDIHNPASIDKYGLKKLVLNFLEKSKSLFTLLNITGLTSSEISKESGKHGHKLVIIFNAYEYSKNLASEKRWNI